MFAYNKKRLPGTGQALLVPTLDGKNYFGITFSSSELADDPVTSREGAEVLDRQLVGEELGAVLRVTESFAVPFA